MAASFFHRALNGGEATRTKPVLLVLSVVLALASSASAIDGRNLTDGFIQVELAEGNFVVQSPYDVPENQRYSYDNVTGVRTFLVYASDKPFNTVTGTKPRTEVRLTVSTQATMSYHFICSFSNLHDAYIRVFARTTQCHDYSSGVWQFEGYGYVPAGTSGASVMQIHNEDGGAHATTLMLWVYNSTLRYYDRQVVEDGAYDRWFRLNVVHDVGVSTVRRRRREATGAGTRRRLALLQVQRVRHC